MFRPLLPRIRNSWYKPVWSDKAERLYGVPSQTRQRPSEVSIYSTNTHRICCFLVLPEMWSTHWNELILKCYVCERERQTDRQTERQTDRQTDRQRDRQTGCRDVICWAVIWYDMILYDKIEVPERVSYPCLLYTPRSDRQLLGSLAFLESMRLIHTGAAAHTFKPAHMHAHRHTHYRTLAHTRFIKQRPWCSKLCYSCYVVV